MVIRNFGTVAVLGLVAGCYNTPTENPHPGDWTIDDFQSRNGAAQPAGYELPHLEQWECRPKDGTHTIRRCKVIEDPEPLPGQASNMVLHLGSTLWSSEDGKDFTRSEVATFIDPPQDLRDFASFSLRAMLVLQTLTPNLKVQLSCLQVRAADGGVSSNPCVLAMQEIGKTWGDYSFEVGNFTAPAEPADEKVSPEDCLAHVDGIKITVDSESNVPKGERKEFDLYVDNIKFIRKH